MGYNDINYDFNCGEGGVEYVVCEGFIFEFQIYYLFVFFTGGLMCNLVRLYRYNQTRLKRHKWYFII